MWLKARFDALLEWFQGSVRRQALALGLVLAALQVALALSITPEKSARQAYESLCLWDCTWYETIVSQGYYTTIPPVKQRKMLANVAFFPGYPMLARLVSRTTGLSAKLSLIVVAQAFCVVFWSAFWMLLRKWRIPLLVSALAVLAVLAHPAALFLVSGYSESLFLSCLLLFLLSLPVESQSGRLSSASAGFLMSATRIIGIPAAGIPLIHRVSRACVQRRWPTVGEIKALAVTSVLSISGGIAFLAYCQARFGNYNLYMETQRIGWGIVPDYGAIWKWGSFRFMFPIDQWATVISAVAFLALLALESHAALTLKSTGFRRRSPAYAAAVLCFFITLSGLKSVQFLSMIRYTLPWSVLLTACLAQLSVRLVPKPGPVTRAGLVMLAAALLVLLCSVQLPHFQNFLRNRWFA